MSNMAAVGAYLEYLRKEHHQLSRSDLVKQLHPYLGRTPHPNSLVAIEGGTQTPGMDLLFALIRVLQANIMVIMQLYYDPHATKADGIAAAQAWVAQAPSLPTATPPTDDADLFTILTLLIRLHPHPGALVEARRFLEGLLVGHTATALPPPADEAPDQESS